MRNANFNRILFLAGGLVIACCLASGLQFSRIDNDPAQYFDSDNGDEAFHKPCCLLLCSLTGLKSPTGSTGLDLLNMDWNYNEAHSPG